MEKNEKVQKIGNYFSRDKNELSYWNVAIDSCGSNRERCIFKYQGTKSLFVFFHSVEIL